MYWVNDDKPTSKVVIHYDYCLFAQERDKLSRDGAWLGPFKTLPEARHTASGVQSLAAVPCGVCSIS